MLSCIKRKYRDRTFLFLASETVLVGFIQKKLSQEIILFLHHIGFNLQYNYVILKSHFCVQFSVLRL